MITAKNNQQLKTIKKLLSSVKERREKGSFVAEGLRICSEVPEPLLESLFLSKSCGERFGLSEASGAEEIRRALKAQGFSNLPQKFQVELVEDGLFRSLSDTVNPQGVLAVVKQPQWKEEELELGSRKCLLLDGVRDPGNLGTIIRTAEAAGVCAVFLSPDCVDAFNPKVIRSTMGSIFRVPVISEELLPRIERLKQLGILVYGSSLEAKKSHKEADLSKAAIIIGSEAEGISQRVLEQTSCNLKIPMQGKVESLNAAISAAILMFA